MVHNFSLYYKVIVIKTVWYSPKNRHIRSVELSRELPNISMHVLLVNLWWRRQENTMGKRQSP